MAIFKVEYLNVNELRVVKRHPPSLLRQSSLWNKQNTDTEYNAVKAGTLRIVMAIVSDTNLLSTCQYMATPFGLVAATKAVLCYKIWPTVCPRTIVDQLTECWLCLDTGRTPGLLI